MAFAAGIGRRAYDAVYVLMGQLRGGLLVATSVASAIFGAVCGSGAATNVAIGKIALPEMKKRNYNQSLALGCVACSGTIGFMIPPSSVFIIYGDLGRSSSIGTALLLQECLPRHSDHSPCLFSPPWPYAGHSRPTACSERNHRGEEASGPVRVLPRRCAVSCW